MFTKRAPIFQKFDLDTNFMVYKGCGNDELLPFCELHITQNLAVKHETQRGEIQHGATSYLVSQCLLKDN